MRSLLVLTVLLIAPTDEMRERIIGRAFTGGETERNLTHLCDRIGGRMSGAASGHAAEEHAAEVFQRYNLQNIHFEPFPMQGWERGEITCTVSEPARRTIHAVSMGNTPSTPTEGVFAPIIDVGHGSPGEFEKAAEAVKGKIVIVKPGGPPGHRPVHRSEKMILCEKYGAVAMVTDKGAPGGLPPVGICAVDGIAPMIGVGIAYEDGMWIRRLLAAGETVRMRIRAVNRTAKVEARNVVGEIPGETDEVVIVGGHLDSWDLGQGTIDNGTGAVTVMEIARILSSLETKPRRTVRFVLFMGEEVGLYGSRAYVKDHADEMDRIVFMMNLDMIGRPTGLRLGGVDAAVDEFREMAASLHELGVGPEVRNKAGMHSDHQPFLFEGVPTCSIRTHIREEQVKHYHTSGDTLDKADFGDLQAAAAVASVVVWDLATRQERIAPRLGADQLREVLIRDGLKEPLELRGKWRW
jgi:Iap family predicted aminopeptidase